MLTPMLTYEECNELIRSARNPENGKPLCNNTRLFRRDQNTFAVRLHNTDILEIDCDKTYTYYTGGWRTVTTKERLNRYGPVYVFSERRVWYCEHPRQTVTPFFEGIRFNTLGELLNPPDPEETALRRATERLLDKTITRYIDAMLAAKKAGELPLPSGGDCWGCAFTVTDVPPKFGPERDPMGQDHLLGHLGLHPDDSMNGDGFYLVPSLLGNAITECGYREPAFIWHYGGTNNLRRALLNYFRARRERMIDMLLRASKQPEEQHA